MEYLRPLRDAGENLWLRGRDGEKLRVWFPCRRSPSGGCFRSSNFRSRLNHIAALHRGFHHDVFDKGGHLALFLGEGSNRQTLFRARQRHVKKPPLFLNVKVSLRQSFFHQCGWKFKKWRAISCGEGALVHAQKKDVRKLQSLCAVHGHQLDGVTGRIVFKAERSTRLFEIVEVFENLGYSARFTFGLPVLYDLRKLIDV